MGVAYARGAAQPDEAVLDEILTDDGMTPRWWSNAPGDTYAPHEHGFHKVLFCARGSITFHTDDGDVELHAGDRLDIEPGTTHGATVGRDGVTCVEGARSVSG